MGSGVGHPDLALYRLVKSGETGLNLRLADLFDREIELPTLGQAITDLLRRRPIRLRIKAYPGQLIERLIRIQKSVDKEIEKEVRKVKQANV